jgi:hypothetical protein
MTFVASSHWRWRRARPWLQLDRRGPPEDRDHHLQRVLVEVHLVDHTVEGGERSLIDTHLLPLLEHVLGLGLLRRRLDLRQNLIDLVLTEWGRLGAGPDKAGHLRRVLHDVPRVVGHVHLDKDVAGEEPLRGHHLPPAAHLHDVLGRDEDFPDLPLKAVRLHPLLQGLFHLLLEP